MSSIEDSISPSSLRKAGQPVLQISLLSVIGWLAFEVNNINANIAALSLDLRTGLVVQESRLEAFITMEGERRDADRDAFALQLRSLEQVVTRLDARTDRLERTMTGNAP